MRNNIKCRLLMYTILTCIISHKRHLGTTPNYRCRITIVHPRGVCHTQSANEQRIAFFGVLHIFLQYIGFHYSLYN